MFASTRLLGLTGDEAFISSSLDGGGKVWRLWATVGTMETAPRDYAYDLWCVKR